MDDQTERTEKLAEIVAYTRRDLAQRDAAGPQPTIVINYHEAERPAPPPPPPQDIASKYAGHFVLLLGACVILGILGVVAAYLLPLIMGMLATLAIFAGAVAVLAIAVAAAIKSLGQTSESHKINREVVEDLRRSRRR